MLLFAGMIIGKNIVKTYSTDVILNKVNFRIGNNKKIGIVGKNGCGKSTLLNIVAGALEYDEGNIQIDNELIGYITQEFNYDSKELSKELVGVYLEKQLEFEWNTYKIDQLVNQLEFNNYDPYQELGTMSEGQKMKTKMIIQKKDQKDKGSFFK